MAIVHEAALVFSTPGLAGVSIRGLEEPGLDVIEAAFEVRVATVPPHSLMPPNVVAAASPDGR